MTNQLTIFDELYPKYKITKPIRLIELFAGYGSQALALKYLNVPFEHYKICEWAIKSIQAYKDLHFNENKKDYSKGKTIEQIREQLYNFGISSNYNKSISRESINGIKEKNARQIYNNIYSTNNLVDVKNIKGKYLEIVDTDKFDYILTYSFPCQDLSLAGKGKGMSDTSTRSGMLWEIERILTECKDIGSLPQVLLMENVPQIHSENNVKDFNKWQLRLEELGYKNYFQDLTATDYEIPQTRTRCFMISILGNYSYSFPKGKILKLRLKDLLEKNVDEKYYLSDKMIEYIISEDAKYKVNPNNLKINREIACYKTTREGNTRADTSDYICNEFKKNYSLRRKNAAKKDYLEVTVGDDVVVNKPEMISGFGKIGSTGQYHQQNRIYSDDLAISVTTSFNPYYKNKLRIRKLTPRECFRLMGVRDNDFDKVAKNQSDSSLYHLAGDSIVVNILMALFKELL